MVGAASTWSGLARAKPSRASHQSTRDAAKPPMNRNWPRKRGTALATECCVRRMSFDRRAGRFRRLALENALALRDAFRNLLLGPGPDLVLSRVRCDELLELPPINHREAGV